MKENKEEEKTHVANPSTSGICPPPKPPDPKASKGLGAAPPPGAKEAKGLAPKPEAALGAANLVEEDAQGCKADERA